MLKSILKKLGYVHENTLKDRDDENYSKGYSNAMQQKEDTYKRLLSEKEKKLTSIIKNLKKDNKMLQKQHKADMKAYANYEHELEYQNEVLKSLDPILDVLHLNIGKIKKKKNDIELFSNRKEKKGKKIKRLFNKYEVDEEVTEDELQSDHHKT